MTIETLLEAIQNFRSSIDQWGVTAETLLAVAFLATVMFVLSLREVATWFLRVHSLRDEVRSLRKDIAELKGMMATSGPSPIAVTIEEEEEEPVVTISKKKDEEKPAKAFRLDH